MKQMNAMRALALSQHNKIKTASASGELVVVERIRSADGKPLYILYPWYKWTRHSEGHVNSSSFALECDLSDEGIHLIDARWLPLEEPIYTEGKIPHE